MSSNQKLFITLMVLCAFLIGFVVKTVSTPNQASARTNSANTDIPAQCEESLSQAGKAIDSYREIALFKTKDIISLLKQIVEAGKQESTKPLFTNEGEKKEKLYTEESERYLTMAKSDVAKFSKSADSCDVHLNINF